ncbi:AAA family ATPase [Mycoplasmopsis cricetuli]|uniref:AAA family ATPase n=1 Tax=Mycoplasmopsis cricetuli TaxID=171283 RepID=UPI00046FD558|nr:AAA family ATPase [Mycoplasmopsis cricetuli]
MSYYNSIKQIPQKIMHKNIIILSGNVNDFIFLDNLNDQSLNDNQEIQDLPKGIFLKLSQYIGFYLKNNSFQKIEHFIPSKGVIDLNKSFVDILFPKEEEEEDFSKLDDEEAEFEQNEENQVSPIEQYINEIILYIEDLKKQNKPIKKIAFIIDLSDLLLKEVNSTIIANLISSFIDLSNPFVDKYLKEKYKLILICKNKEILNNLIIENNIELNFHTIQVPNTREREDFIEANTSRFNEFLIEEKLDKSNRSKEFNDAIALTNGLSFREIIQIANVAANNKFKDFKELYRVVFLDKKESEWEKINQEKLKNFQVEMKKRVKGQDFAIKQMEKTLIRSFVGLSDLSSSHDNKRKPKGILFFTGPTGTGKTELSKAFAEFIFGDENALIRFDMSEYNHEHSDEKLIGSPPGYVGYESGGQLTNAVKQKPFSVLLFDEIEKAHGRILDKFLQILEDGRLTSSKGELIDFSETFIIFTSNIGVKETLNLAKDNNDVDLIRKTFKKEIEKYFKETLGRPEILNRIGEKNIVPFNFITDHEIIKEIINSKLKKLKNNLYKDKLIQLQEENEETLKYLIIEVKKGFKPELGARGLISEFEKKFIDKMIYFLFENYQQILANKKNGILTKIKFDYSNEKTDFIFSIL